MKWEKTVLLAIITVTLLFLSYFFLLEENSILESPSKKNHKNGFHLRKLIGYSRELVPSANPVVCDVDKGKQLYSNTYWQHFGNTKLYLYSSFYDNRYHYRGVNFTQIRILGMSKGKLEEPLHCLLWRNNLSYTIEAQSTEIWHQNWDIAHSSVYYRPYIISCPLPQTVKNVDGVSIIPSSCEKPTVYLPLKQPESITKEDFVVCVKGMDYADDISLRLVEWIELQFLLGADKIMLYLFAVHPNVARVLAYYQNLGKIDVRSLTLPGDDPNDPSERSRFLRENIWQKRRHELIPYNDCFYRHMHTHRFVVLLDLDEVIVPVQNRTWKEMMEDIFASQSNTLEIYCSLSVRNVYFFDEFGTSNNVTIPPFMHILRHVYRSANFSKLGHAVKSFFSTNTTLAVFNHYAMMPLYSKLRRNGLISKNIAQLHHYRSECPLLMQKDCEKNFLRYRKRDTLVWKYANELVKRVENVIEKVHLEIN